MLPLENQKFIDDISNWLKEPTKINPTFRKATKEQQLAALKNVYKEPIIIYRMSFHRKYAASKLCHYCEIFDQKTSLKHNSEVCSYERLRVIVADNYDNEQNYCAECSANLFHIVNYNRR